MRKHTKESFLSAVFYSPDGCWYWTNAVNKNGYGIAMVKGKVMLSHRASFEFHKGPISKDMCVCHQCDNKLCINPDHLWLGTNKDNHEDMVKKGRRANFKGENNGQRRITTNDAIKIKEMISEGYRPKSISHSLAISEHIIKEIKRGRTWRHV